MASSGLIINAVSSRSADTARTPAQRGDAECASSLSQKGTADGPPRLTGESQRIDRGTVAAKAAHRVAGAFGLLAGETIAAARPAQAANGDNMLLGKDNS